MPSLHQIALNTADVPIDTGGGVIVTVTYYPGRITEKMIADMQAMTKLDDDADRIIEGFGNFNKALAHLIKDWNLYEDEAETIKFPIGEGERFSELPIPLRMKIYMGITGDVDPEAIAPQIKTKN